IERGDTPFGPEIGRQAHIGQRLAIEIKRQALDGTGAEIPAGKDGVWGNTAKWFGHGRWLLAAENQRRHPVAFLETSARMALRGMCKTSMAALMMRILA